MGHRGALLLATALFLQPGSIQAGRRLVDEGWELAEGPFRVVAVSVLGVTGVPATKGRPPRVSFQVNAVLRGKGVPERFEALWRAADCCSSDTAPPHSGPPGFPQWREEPLIAPSVGEKLIVLVLGSNGGLEIYEDRRYSDTPENRKWVRTRMADHRARVRRWQAKLRAEERQAARQEDVRMQEARSRLAVLCQQATSVWVATLSSWAEAVSSSENSVTIGRARALKGWAPRVPVDGSLAEPRVLFARDAVLERAIYQAYDDERQVILFLRFQRRDGRKTVWRSVDPPFGLLPANPAVVAEVREALGAVP